MPRTREDSRARFHAAIKREALAQMAEGGTAAVSVNAIGRRLDVSGPAIYRYFSGRPALLAELALDAYGDLDDHLAAHAGSLTSLASAYRGWALENPHRYRLLFDDPAAAYDNQAPELVMAAQAIMDRLLSVLAASDGEPPPASTRALDAEVARWLTARGGDAAPALGLQAVRIWTALHGLVSLELGGNLASMGLDGGRLLREMLAREG